MLRADGCRSGACRLGGEASTFFRFMPGIARLLRMDRENHEPIRRQFSATLHRNIFEQHNVSTILALLSAYLRTEPAVVSRGSASPGNGSFGCRFEAQIRQFDGSAVALSRRLTGGEAP